MRRTQIVRKSRPDLIDLGSLWQSDCWKDGSNLIKITVLMGMGVLDKGLHSNWPKVVQKIPLINWKWGPSYPNIPLLTNMMVRQTADPVDWIMLSGANQTCTNHWKALYDHHRSIIVSRRDPPNHHVQCKDLLPLIWSSLDECCRSHSKTFHIKGA